MIIDISQEVFSCKVFPGDEAPKPDRAMSIQKGDICNLTNFSMCAHNGTHADAPFHFIDGGSTIDRIPLDVFVGDCYVALHAGEVTREAALDIMGRARAAGADRRILIKGDAVMTAQGAQVFAQAGILLIGNESQTVGPEDSPRNVHLILLGREVTLLEGVRLVGVEEGKYFLMAQPLNLGGSDGSPCRAVLMKSE
jgi:arylformamidase